MKIKKFISKQELAYLVHEIEHIAFGVSSYSETVGYADKLKKLSRFLLGKSDKRSAFRRRDGD